MHIPNKVALTGPDKGKSERPITVRNAATTYYGEIVCLHRPLIPQDYMAPIIMDGLSGVGTTDECSLRANA